MQQNRQTCFREPIKVSSSFAIYKKSTVLRVRIFKFIEVTSTGLVMGEGLKYLKK
ncbi:hypothetical protein MANES_06G091201v8 [Manihot esculenta]|uniref:Uncharacterized protein n=1 Tax=Manihot esculenta TaxID=3983 RepID=A0ACB7HII9_MANES|nr:hypothetical protein MANES_06G091201v8 [Manihot esculenta]